MAETKAPLEGLTEITVCSPDGTNERRGWVIVSNVVCMTDWRGPVAGVMEVLTVDGSRFHIKDPTVVAEQQRRASEPPNS